VVAVMRLEELHRRHDVAVESRWLSIAILVRGVDLVLGTQHGVEDLAHRREIRARLLARAAVAPDLVLRRAAAAGCRASNPRSRSR
jgi:hypothetical protein